jgi:hypothetical protein
MGITSERMAYKHHIVEFRAHRPALLIRHVNTLQNASGTEFETSFRQLKSHRFRLNQPNTTICFIFLHFETSSTIIVSRRRGSLS